MMNLLKIVKRLSMVINMMKRINSKKLFFGKVIVLVNEKFTECLPKINIY